MSGLITEALHAISNGVDAKNVTEFFHIKETTPKLRIETMGSDERPWKEVKRSEIHADYKKPSPFK